MSLNIDSHHQIKKSLFLFSDRKRIIYYLRRSNATKRSVLRRSNNKNLLSLHTRQRGFKDFLPEKTTNVRKLNVFFCGNKLKSVCFFIRDGKVLNYVRSHHHSGRPFLLSIGIILALSSQLLPAIRYTALVFVLRGQVLAVEMQALFIELQVIVRQVVM